eukprot:scaffold39504_cov64-Cyclotella_meneghiniana.AAC.1
MPFLLASQILLGAPLSFQALECAWCLIQLLPLTVDQPGYSTMAIFSSPCPITMTPTLQQQPIWLLGSVGLCWVGHLEVLTSKVMHILILYDSFQH